jgi:hypothetical protein|nr:MAG TPA: hypothetical protein [Caudoviricetes sp.]
MTRNSVKFLWIETIYEHFFLHIDMDRIESFTFYKDLIEISYYSRKLRLRDNNADYEFNKENRSDVLFLKNFKDVYDKLMSLCEDNEL